MARSALSLKTPTIHKQEAFDAILEQRNRFKGFLAARIANAAEAEDLLQQSLLKALNRGGGLRRGESAVNWLYRILRNAVVDHCRDHPSELRGDERLLCDLLAGREGRAERAAEWDTALCDCVRGLLPALNPRYAELIRRIELEREPKVAVARDLKMKVATMDVVLHRARASLRQLLEVMCGSCSRDTCWNLSARKKTCKVPH